MVWVGEIEDCVAQQDQKLFVFVHEHASEWAILGLDYDVLSRPLPELGLSRPKWLGVLTDDEGRVLTLLSLFFLFFTFTQCFYPQVRLFITAWEDGLSLLQFPYIFPPWHIFACVRSGERRLHNTPCLGGV